MAKKETTTQELTLSNPDLKPSFAKFEAIRIKMSEMAQQCLKIKVKDDASLSVCEQNLSKMNDLVNSIEETRKELKAPHWDKCTAIDAFAKLITEEPKDSMAHMKNEKLEYVKKIEAEKKRKADIQTSFDSLNEWCSSQIHEFTTLKSIEKSISTLEVQTEEKIKTKFQELADEAKEIIEKYIKLFTLKKTELEALETASPDEQEAIKAEMAEQTASIQESVAEAKIQSEVAQTNLAMSTPKGIRKTWKFELADINKVPKEWLTIDEEKVNEFLKNNKEGLTDGGVINGVKFFKVSSVTA